MSNKKNSIIAAIMALAMILAMSVPAFAAETIEPSAPTVATLTAPTNAANGTPRIGSCYTVTINGQYTTVATAHNCNNRFYIGDLPYGYQVDIRMMNGNTIIWEQIGALTSNTNRTLWCGANVTAIQARVSSSTSIFPVTALYTLGVDTEV